MSATKEKILRSALRLFNEHGIASITLRTIAQDVGISQGNLNYHFKKREDIIEALYHKLVATMDTELQALYTQASDIALLFDLSYHSMKVFYGYKFLLVDIVAIMRTHPTIKEHYFMLQYYRKQQFLALFQRMIEHDVLRAEETSGEYERVYERMTILGDFWIATSEILQSNTDSESILQHYHYVLLDAIYPYLTKKGKKLYTQKLAEYQIQG